MLASSLGPTTDLTCRTFLSYCACSSCFQRKSAANGRYLETVYEWHTFTQFITREDSSHYRASLWCRSQVSRILFHFCLNLPATFSQPGNGLLVKPCALNGTPFRLLHANQGSRLNFQMGEHYLVFDSALYIWLCCLWAGGLGGHKLTGRQVCNDICKLDA